MLTKRIIPCLDVKDGQVVKGIKFGNLQLAGEAVELARYYDAEGADELVFLDITASKEKRPLLYHLIERTAQEVFIPFTIGGGIRTCQDIRRLLECGADKVSLNTAAVENPQLIWEAAQTFGSQCIVCAIDAKRVSEKKWEVYTHGGSRPTGIDAVAWAKRVVALGVGEILLTSMDADGTKQGFDLELIRQTSEAVAVPVIASGGGGELFHFWEAVVYGKADAVLAASVFHYRQISIPQLKDYLSHRQIPVRR